MARDYTRLGISAVAGSVRDMLTGRAQPGTFDFVYAAGLYDYLGAAAATALTRKLFDMTRPGFLPDPIQLTYGRRSGRQHQDPACGGRGSGGRGHSCLRLLWAMLRVGSSTRDPPGRDQVLGMGRLGLKDAAQAAFITAPSMTTPEVTYFHSATSSLRARAVIVTFLRRPPSRLTRSSNHRVSADCG